MQKRAFKFNIMDVLILLVILAVAAVLLYVFVLSDKPILRAAETHTVTYVVEVAGLNEEYRDLIAVGDEVIDSAKKLPIGTITAVETQEYFYMGENSREGTLVLSPVDGFVTQYVTIEAEASLVSDGYPKYSIGGYDIFVGSLVYLSLPNLVCSGYCISLDVH